MNNIELKTNKYKSATNNPICEEIATFCEEPVFTNALLNDAVCVVMVKNKIEFRPGCKEALYLLDKEPEVIYIMLRPLDIVVFCQSKIETYSGVEDVCQHCNTSRESVEHLATRCITMPCYDHTKRYNNLYDAYIYSYRSDIILSFQNELYHSIQKILDNKQYEVLENLLGLIYKCTVVIIPYGINWNGIDREISKKVPGIIERGVWPGKKDFYEQLKSKKIGHKQVNLKNIFALILEGFYSEDCLNGFMPNSSDSYPLESNIKENSGNNDQKLIFQSTHYTLDLNNVQIFENEQNEDRNMEKRYPRLYTYPKLLKNTSDNSLDEISSTVHFDSHISHDTLQNYKESYDFKLDCNLDDSKS
ncbi:hypothetical protein CWI38_1037p0010, partial [Hamiltosporidium tvaerminnensis]